MMIIYQLILFKILSMQPNKFTSRHIGPKKMKFQKCYRLGSRFDRELLSQTLPEEIRLKHPHLARRISEHRFLNELRALSDENQLFETYIGMATTPLLLQRSYIEIYWKTQVGILPTHLIKQKLPRGD